MKWNSFFPLSEEDIKMDKKLGIERRPALGCLLSIGGSLLFWGFIYMVYVYCIR
jgi:hypothetical protein